jgi:hypothetical protein
MFFLLLNYFYVIRCFKNMGFRDLNKFPAMKAKYEAFKAWQDKTPEQRQQAYAAVTDEAGRVKVEKTGGYISPFNSTGTNLIYLPSRLINNTQSGAGATLAGIVKGLVDEFTHTTIPSGGIAVQQAGYKFAQLTLTTVIPGTTKSKSRITGAMYSKPTVDSVSSKFGQKTAGQDFDAVVALIKAKTAYTTHMSGNGGKNRAKFKPEG